MSVNVGTLFATLRLDTAPFNTALGGVGGTLRTIGAGFGQVGSSLTTSLTLPLLGAGGAIVSLSTDFDTALRRIIGLTNVTAGEIDGIRTAILAMATETGRKPQELADAFYFLASAGFTGKEALDVLEVTARAAASGLGDTADIAAVTGLSINAWGKENLTATKAVDTLIAAIREGTAEPAEFAASLGGVAGAASQIGATFPEVTAAIAAMTIKGIDAAAASVSLNAVFTSLFKPTSEAEKQLKLMGLSAAGLRKSIKDDGLLPTLTLLSEKFAGNEEATAKVFGNVRALRGIFALTTGDAAQTARIFDAVAASTGSLDKAFQATEGPGRELDRGIADLQGTLIEFGEVVLPIVIEGMHSLRDILAGIRKWWDSLDEAGQKNAITFGILAAAAGPVLLILGALIGAIGALLSPIGLVIAALAGIGIAINKNFGGLGDIFNAIVGYVGPVVEAIGHLFEALSSGDDVESGFIETMENLGEKLGPFGDLFRSLAETIADVFRLIQDEIIPTFVAAWEAILPSLQGAFAVLTEQILPGVAAAFAWITDNILPPIVAAFQAIAENVIPILAAALDTVVSVIRDNWPTIVSIAQHVGDAVKVAIEVISTVIQAVAPVIRWLAERIFPIIGAAAGVLLSVIDAVFGAIGPIFDAVVGVAQAFGDFLGRVWQGIMDQLAGLAAFFGQVFDGVREAIRIVLSVFYIAASIIGMAIQAIVDFLSDLLRPAVEALAPVFDAVFGAIGAVVGAVASAIGGAIQWIVDNVFPIFGAAADAVGGVVGGAFRAVQGVIGAVAGAIGAVLGTVGRVVFGALGAAAQAVQKVIAGAFDLIGGVIRKALEIIRPVTDAIGGAFRAMGRIVRGVWDAITGTIKGAINGVISAINGLIRALNGIQIHIPGVDTPFGKVGKFDWGGLNLHQIPYLAQGTPHFGGGWAILGERGPELARLPAGTQVHDAAETAGLLRGGNSREIHNHYQLTVQGNVEAKDEPTVLQTLQRLATVAQA